jgi:hypothetical protein
VESGLKEHLKAEEVVSGSGVDGALAALHVAQKVRKKCRGFIRSAAILYAYTLLLLTVPQPQGSRF